MKIALPGTRSGNIEDRRGASSGLGGGFPLPIGALAGMGIPGIILIVAIVVLQGVLSGGGGFGVNPALPGAQAPAADNGSLPGAPDANSDQVKFVSFVLDDVQSFWSSEFERSGKTYTPARLVLYTDA